MKYLVIRYNSVKERYERRTELPLTVWERVDGDEFVEESGWEPVTTSKVVYPETEGLTSTVSGSISSVGSFDDVRKT